MFRRFLVLIALGLLVLPLEGQSKWGVGGCAPVGAKTPVLIGDNPASEPIGSYNDGTSGWFAFQGSPGYFGWYRKNVLIGRWHQPTKTWEEWNGRRWLSPCNPPWFVQPMGLPGAIMDRDGSINFGVDRTKLASSEKFYVGSEEINRGEFDVMIGDPAKDDSKLPQVLVLDTNALRRKEVFDTLSTKFAGKARFSTADPSNKDQAPFLDGWKLNQDEGFKKNNHATFVMGPREKDGFAKVVYASYDPKPLNALTDEVGVRVDPNYEPKNNPTGGSKVDWSWASKGVWYVIAALFGLGLGYRLSRGDSKPEVPVPLAGPSTPAQALITALQMWKEDQTIREEEAKARVSEVIELRKAIAEIAEKMK